MDTALHRHESRAACAVGVTSALVSSANPDIAAPVNPVLTDSAVAEQTMPQPDWDGPYRPPLTGAVDVVAEVRGV